ncbi:MAG: hypothetical protein IPL46_35145 [Saprospiraceae bacterium]|nr:hypothetical protein [Saprospiraceae bacterium]
MIAYQTWLFILCGLMLTPWTIQAQSGIPNRGAGGNNSSPTFDEQFEEDTLDVKYFYQNSPRVVYSFDDTLLTHFHEFDISRLDGPTYLNLGIPGSPLRALIAAPGAYTGFSVGLDSYKPYYIDDHNFRFYESKKAITRVFYTKGQSQNDGVLRTSFGRSFKDRIRLSLDYNRYTNFGIYSRQAGRNTNLGVGIGYESKNQRLLIFASHYSNIFTQQHNGGITTDTLFTADFSEERTTIPTYLANAATRDDHKSLKINTYYQLFGRDSIKRDGGLWMQYVFRADNHYFKFSDTGLTAESADYYGSLITDSRGMRNFVEHRRIVNDISLNLGNVQNRVLKTGLRNIINNINQEPIQSKITEWKLYGDAKWNFADRLLLNSQAELNINRENASFWLVALLILILGRPDT